jgi:hypothetical protein
MEAIVWIIVVVIVLLLIVGLISVVIKVLVVSIAAILAGTASGYLVLIVADWMQVRKLSNPAMLASVASLRLTSTGLHFELADAKVQKWVSSNNLNWLASLASGTVAAFALFLGVTETPEINSAMGNLGPVVRFLSWLTPVVLMVVFAKGAGMNRSRKDRIRSRVDSLAAQLRSCLMSVGKLDEIEANVKAMTQNLKIDWPDEYRRALERYIDVNGATLVLNPAPADDLLKALIALSSIDRDRLQRATREWDAVWKRYIEVAEVLCYVDRPAIALALDDLARGLPALKVLLFRREWDEFSAQLQDAEDALGMLERNASERETDPAEPATTTGTDPYLALNVDRNSSYEQIHRAWLKLHVRLKDDLRDAKTSDDKQEIERCFTEINVAWNQIQFEIKCAKGEHLWVDNTIHGGPTICKICRTQRQTVAS